MSTEDTSVGPTPEGHRPPSARCSRTQCSTSETCVVAAVHDASESRARSARMIASCWAWVQAVASCWTTARQNPHPGRPAGDGGGQRVQRGVAGGGDDRRVELDVLGDQALGVGQPPHPLAAFGEPVERGVVDARRGQCGGRGLEHPAALEELGDPALVDEVEERPGRPHQPFGAQVGDEGAVPAAHLEDPGARQRAHRLAEREPGHREVRGEVALRREPLPRAELAGLDPRHEGAHHPVDDAAAHDAGAAQTAPSGNAWAARDAGRISALYPGRSGAR